MRRGWKTLNELKDYLTSKGYDGIFLDALPDPSDQPEAIGLFEWNHTVGAINDGTGTHYIQIQVRRRCYADARQVCTELFQLLDSGPDEMVIDLTPDVFCIARPRRGPVKLAAGGGYATFYYELALWGPN